MTDRAEIETRVKKVLAEQLAVDEAQVVPDARFAEDLNADSLDLVEAVLALEEEWSIEIPEEEMESVKTVGQDLLHPGFDLSSIGHARFLLCSPPVPPRLKGGTPSDTIHAVRPPSTGITAPFTYDASSDITNRTTADTSSKVAVRAIGV